MEGRITAMQAYCARCGAKRPVVSFIVSISKAGREIVWGRCEVCGGAVRCSRPTPTPQPAGRETWGVRIRRILSALWN